MTKTLSDTQLQILAAAAGHEAQLAKAPQGLAAAARNAVFRSMLKSGLLEEVAAPDEYRGLAWRQDESGSSIALRVTKAGLRAIGDEFAPNPAAGAPVPRWRPRKCLLSGAACVTPQRPCWPPGTPLARAKQACRSWETSASRWSACVGCWPDGNLDRSPTLLAHPAAHGRGRSSRRC
jgi:hypothetical protein